MKRRTLIKSLAALPAAAMAGQLWAAPASKTGREIDVRRGA